MKREDLIKLGLADDAVIDAIMAANGKDIESHKAKLTTAQAEFDGVKRQLTEAGVTIEGFKKLDVDGIKAAADEWKVKAETAQAEALKQVAALRFDHALESALSGAKAKDTLSVRAHLKTEGLKLKDDGSIDGLEDQLTKVKSEKSYLFENDVPTPKIVIGGNSKSIINDSVVDAARKAAGLTTSGDK